jgi:lipopolysaccharide/colanic/teichoic acid biosynthesis glycosyltransferase
MQRNVYLKDWKADQVKSTKKKIIYIGVHDQDFIDKKLELNYECIIFNTAFQAYPWMRYNALTREVNPEAIICDLEYPGGNAYVLFDIIKSYDHLKTVPFIVLAKNASISERKKAIKAGIDDFYTLPVKVDDLAERMVFLQKFKKDKENFDAATEIPYQFKMPVIKRSLDIFVSALILLVLSPILLLIAMIIKLESKGPVFYISKRAGTGYRIFDFYKFRSMRQGAESELQKLMHLNQYAANGGKFVKIENDPRVTRFGKFLRNTSLDEIPQLINVLKGDMSLVGNRPLPLYEAEQLTRDQWAERFLAPAGITGLWQVTKRGKKEMSEEERMDLDITYAKKYSLLMDFRILIRTIPALLQKQSV